MVLVQEDCNKLLCVARVEESTGKVEAEKVKEVLDNWGVAEKVIACGFDTTSANNGVHKVSCVLLQNLLQRLLLWLACRHHVLELVLAAALYYSNTNTNLRWMSKCIYILKMCLLQHQLPSLHWSKKKKIEKMALSQLQLRTISCSTSPY